MDRQSYYNLLHYYRTRHILSDLHRLFHLSVENTSILANKDWKLYIVCLFAGPLYQHLYECFNKPLRSLIIDIYLILSYYLIILNILRNQIVLQLTVVSGCQRFLNKILNHFKLIMAPEWNHILFNTLIGKRYVFVLRYLHYKWFENPTTRIHIHSKDIRLLYKSNYLHKWNLE